MVASRRKLVTIAALVVTNVMLLVPQALYSAEEQQWRGVCMTCAAPGGEYACCEIVNCSAIACNCGTWNCIPQP